ncbi:plastid-lipid-associated protein, chloroplastic-like [Telopea speciosissima]|uniref:plastid-lipid-associated protein, chloroplastic-like n=1 Tax=Telopea speciosissima TaxID=54955 RepID=UPI001CC60DE3|nr:plastid-lipid-associated protein, chloroplastic-like [Telopea speciosissima]
MAGVSSFNPFLCKTLSLSAYPKQGHLWFGKKNLPSTVTVHSVGIPSGKGMEVEGSRFSIGWTSRGLRPFLRIRAAENDDEWGPENEEWTGEGVATALGEEEEEEEKPKEPSEVDKLKKALVDSFYGTGRGLSASSETRAEIVELITQLEALNPTPAPTEALTLLNGKWILAYTSFSGLFPLFSRGTLPLVKVEEISQTIDSDNFTVQNSVQFSGPLATTSFITNAKFEIRSPKRVQIKFEEGIIGTPQLTDSIETPESVDVLGQKIDLTPFKGLITSLQDTASSVAKTISSQPPLKIPITNDNAQSWLLTTYLDDELRISRGDGGSVFVLIKEGSSLLTA